MSDSSDLEKTESPSPRRLAKAREEGQVARSRELTTFLALLAGGAGFSALGAGWVSHTTTALQSSLILSRRDAFETGALGEHLSSFATDALLAVAPLLALVAGAIVASSAVLGGFIFSTKPFTFDLTRLSPAKGLKRTWSTDGLTELVKAIVKSALLGAVGAWILWKDRDAFAGFASMSLTASLSALGQTMIQDFLLLTGGLALIAAADAPVQLWRHHKSLKMTKQEVRDESRESEGDPAQKGRMRQLQRQAAKRRMMSEVPKADVVVVNPTHFSVAIAYNSTMRAPKVIAKGTQLTALRIREIAAEHKIPVLEAPPLARALYKHTDLGREIPMALYEAVALVMAYVFQVKRYRTQGGAWPNKPDALPVPAELDFTPTAADDDAAADEEDSYA
jgi:flagellar biosynthetic protein FlhB